MGLMLSMLFACRNIPAIAEDTQSVADLKKQVETLQKKVDELESEKKQSPIAVQDQFQGGIGFVGDPFEDINKMQEQMDRMFQNSFGRSGAKQGIFSSNMSFDPDFDLKQTDKGYEIRFDMKGMDKNKIDIQINDHSITIKGEQSRKDKKESQNQYFSSESFGSFMKTIPLPADADTTKIKTEKEGDSIVIRLPKKSK